MTKSVFYEDAYLTRIDATVTAVDGELIEFDRTIFYPMGGGQPGDTGFVTGNDGAKHRIIDTRKGGAPGSIVHQLDTTEHGIGVGDPLTLEIDWDRRYRLMKMHTGMHLLGSLIPVGVTGGAVGEDKSRLDFDLGEHQVDKESLTRELNRLVEEAHDVVIESIEEAELDANPDLVRTMSVQPPRGAGTIRMVRIRDVDYQPCGGTHLRNTREIGAMRVAKIENKGRCNRRFHLVLSDEA
jgi:misacylated tRNA(Ala) deacylase